MGSLLRGKSLGIIGLGAIGKKLVKITSGLQMNYIAYDESYDNSFMKKHKIEHSNFNEL